MSVFMRALCWAVVFLVVVGNRCAYGQDQYHYEQATSFYDADKYRQALYHLRKYIAVDTTNAEAYMMRGNSFLRLNQTDSALADFEVALALDSTLSIVWYNMGHVLQEKELYDSALTYFARYCQLEPADAEGFGRMGYLLQLSGQFNLAYDFFEQAYVLDSTDSYTVYSLATHLYKNDSYELALRYALRGVVLDALNPEFYVLAGKCYLETEQFAKAEHIFNRAIQNDTTNVGLYLYKHEAKVLANTNLPSIRRNKFYNYQFTSINSNSIGQMDAWVTDAESQYYYGTLMAKFVKDPATLGLDEFFMLYYGQAAQPTYSPYSDTGEKAIKEALNNGDFEGCLKQVQERIAENPLEVAYYKLGSSCALEMGNLEVFEAYLHNFVGFIEGIRATGTGLNYDSAYVVALVHDEYELLTYLGLTSGAQRLTSHNGHRFDVLEATKDDNKKEVYFNIDKPYRALFNLLEENEAPAKKDKKGKNKKKAKN